MMLEAAHFDSDAESQGSVLDPALFVLYVKDLTKTFPQGTKHSLYADDLAIWSSSSPDPLKAAHSVQKALNHLEEWSLKWRLPVNPAKCECCFFNTDPHQASHQPQLTLTGTPLPSFSALLFIESSPMVLTSNPSAQSSSPTLKHSAP